MTALVFAADPQWLDVIDQLVAAGTPVNQADAEWGRLPLHVAAGNGRLASVRRLLAHGAGPDLRDPEHHRTPLEECQLFDSDPDGPGHAEVGAILRPLTREQGDGTHPSGSWPRHPDQRRAPWKRTKFTRDAGWHRLRIVRCPGNRPVPGAAMPPARPAPHLAAALPHRAPGPAARQPVLADPWMSSA